MKIFAHFACNDTNGNMQGYIEAFEIDSIDGQVILIEKFGSTTKYDRQTRKIAGCVCRCVQIGRLIVPIQQYELWIGNTAWDGAYISLADAAKIINYLRNHGFTVDTAETRLFSAYNAGEKITAAMLRKAMSSK